MHFRHDPAIQAESDAYVAREEHRMLALHNAGGLLQPWEIEHLKRWGLL